jgi:hypothetical protein
MRRIRRPAVSRKIAIPGCVCKRVEPRLALGLTLRWRWLITSRTLIAGQNPAGRRLLHGLRPRRASRPALHRRIGGVLRRTACRFDRIRYRCHDASVFLYAFGLIKLDCIDMRRGRVWP